MNAADMPANLSRGMLSFPCPRASRIRRTRAFVRRLWRPRANHATRSHSFALLKRSQPDFAIVVAFPSTFFDTAYARLFLHQSNLAYFTLKYIKR